VRAASVTLALVVALAGARVASAEKIRDIVVEGNTKTTSATVELIARIDTGDDWSPEMMDQIKKYLVSSGLFNDVDGFTEPCSPTSTPKCDEDGVRVHLMVKDKHSWVIAPASAFATSPPRSRISPRRSAQNRS